MSKIRGTVGAVTEKWEKVNILIEETGKWYSTKLEWKPNPVPQRGDVIEFESGATDKYLQKVKIVSSGAAAPADGKKPTKRSYQDNTVGIAVGAAMNQATSIFSGVGQEVDLGIIEALAMDLYEVAERLKAQTAAGDIRVSLEERESAKEALDTLAKEFADD